MSTYRIAVIPGDGIGREVVPEGQRVLEAVARRFGFQFEWVDFDWSCERFHRVGEIMPTDGLEQLSGLDAIYFGAVGFPGVPDHISLWELLMPMRRGLKLYVNLRLVKLLPRLTCPLRDKTPGDIDYLIVRENNEGEYSEIGAGCTVEQIRKRHFKSRFLRVKVPTVFMSTPLIWLRRDKEN